MPKNFENYVFISIDIFISLNKAANVVVRT